MTIILIKALQKNPDNEFLLIMLEKQANEQLDGRQLEDQLLDTCMNVNFKDKFNEQANNTLKPDIFNIYATWTKDKTIVRKGPCKSIQDAYNCINAQPNGEIEISIMESGTQWKALITDEAN